MNNRLKIFWLGIHLNILSISSSLTGFPHILTKSTGKMYSSVNDNRSVDVKFTSFYATWIFIKVLAVTRHWISPWNPAIFWTVIVNLYFIITFICLHPHLKIIFSFQTLITVWYAIALTVYRHSVFFQYCRLLLEHVTNYNRNCFTGEANYGRGSNAEICPWREQLHYLSVW